MTADVRPAPSGGGGGGDHPDADHATLTTVIAGLATEVTRATTQEGLKLAKASNLSDLANAGTARTNLGLGTAALAATGDFDAIGAAAAAQAAAIAASQPVDADLTAIAALTTTSYGRALLALADAVAGRTALGLGTAATQNAGAFDAAGAAAAAQAASQPLDSDLTAIAALTTTAFGRGLLALADATALKASLAIAEADVTGLVADLALKAPLASPTFTGTPVLPAATKQAEVIGVALSDETTAITTGTAKATIRMPFAFTLTAVRASLTTASSSGIPTVDINEGGTTILSTKLTIDASEKTSTTAAAAAVISDTSLADDAEITFDVDVAGTGAAGLKVWLIGTRT